MNTDLLFNFDAIKDHIYLEVKPIVHNMLHKSIKGTDLAFYLYVYVADDSDGAYFSVKKIAPEWNKTIEEVFEIAKTNTIKDFLFMPMSSMVVRMSSALDVTLPDDELEKIPLWVITNQFGLLGASVVFVPEVAEKLIQEDVMTIIPCSRHECLILQDNLWNDKANLSSLITSVNESTLRSEDILADHPYFYSKGAGFFM